MLLKNQKEDTTDYTKDWPARYYDIPTGALRREHLKRARSERFGSAKTSMPGRIHSAPADKKGTGVPAGREPRGAFGADMQVYSQNDGPVTILLDTDQM